MTTYTIQKCRAYFTRRGYKITLRNDTGSPFGRVLRVEGSRARFVDYDPAYFWGNDGRKVRAEAIAFARSYNATRERL